MTPIEILALASPIVVGAFTLTFVLVLNHFDEKEAEAERKARASAAE